MDEKEINKIACERANEYASTTEHFAFEADKLDGETLLRNLRFMAFVTGYEEGFKAAKLALTTK